MDTYPQSIIDNRVTIPITGSGYISEPFAYPAKQASLVDTKLLAKLIKWLHNAEMSISETQWRATARNDYAFYAGNQDTEAVKEELKRQKRPNLTYNQIIAKINMLKGLAAQTRSEITLEAVERNDDAVTEVMNMSFKYYYNKLGVPRYEIDCFEHKIKSGRSFFHVYVDSSNPFKPEIKCTRIAGRDIYLDPDLTHYSISEGRFIFHVKWLTKEELKAQWPDVSTESIINFDSAKLGIVGQPIFFNQANDKYRVLTCWYWDYTRTVWFVNPLSGQPDSLKEKDWRKYLRILKKGIKLPNGQDFQLEDTPEHEVTLVKQLKFATFAGNQILEQGDAPKGLNMFPYVLFGAYKDEETNAWFSIIKSMKDPQVGFNTILRQLQHLLNTSPKGILMYEAGSILNIDEYDENSSKPNFKLEIADNKLAQGAVKFTDQPQISVVYGQLIDVFSKLIKTIPGIEEELMGQFTASREAGVTQRQRKESGITVLYSLLDNFRESRLAVGKLILCFIQKYVSPTEFQRIAGESEVTMLALQSGQLNNMETMHYDAVINDGTENVIMRTANMQLLTSFSQNNPGSIPIDVLMEYSNMPPTVIQRVQEYQAAQAEQQEQVRKEEMDLEYAKIKAKSKPAKTSKTT